MKYTLAFGFLGVYLIALAVWVEGPGWLLLWPGVSFLVLAAAYAGLGPRVLGKRPDGRLAWWAVLLLLPYLLLTWAVWHLHRKLGREDCCNEVAPGLWVGRRPFVRELPPGTSLVVDLTAEFPAPRGVRAGRTWLSVPTLDALVPGEQALREVVDKAAAWPGTVYIHCALGHGRSALTAAAVLMARGLAADARQAEAILRRARPGVRLNPAQRRLLERITAEAPRGPHSGEAHDETDPP
jgi:protein-tyrosine phosphatase